MDDVAVRGGLYNEMTQVRPSFIAPTLFLLALYRLTLDDELVLLARDSGRRFRIRRPITQPMQSRNLLMQRLHRLKTPQARHPAACRRHGRVRRNGRFRLGRTLVLGILRTRLSRRGDQIS